MPTRDDKLVRPRSRSQRQITADKATGERIKAARERVGIRQRQMAADLSTLGIPWTQNHQTRTEQGQRPLGLYEAVVIADHLGVSLGSLAGIEDDNALATEQRALQELRAIRHQIETREREIRERL